MTEEVRNIVEAIKEAFEVLSAMELPAEEQKIEITRDAAMTLIAELEQVPEQEKVVKEFDYTLKVAERLQKDFESHAGSVEYLCSQVRHTVNIIKRLSAQLEQVTRERDAAVNELVKLEYPIPCESDELGGSEYCEENCRFKYPQKECWLLYLRERGVEVTNNAQKGSDAKS